MKPEDTLYEVLEISPRASVEVLRAAYRCLAQFHHPDKNIANNDVICNDRIILINNAYSILSDPVARQIYDRKMGLHSQNADRRGGCKDQGGNFAPTGSTPNVSRPFGFRPI
nr:J domain-containing protein [uncultured Albidiferax sp.]